MVDDPNDRSFGQRDAPDGEVDVAKVLFKNLLPPTVLMERTFNEFDVLWNKAGEVLKPTIFVYLQMNK